MNELFSSQILQAAAVMGLNYMFVLIAKTLVRIEFNDLDRILHTNNLLQENIMSK